MIIKIHAIGTTAALAAALTVVAGAAWAAGVTVGEAYSAQRAALLAAGWTPDASYGLKLANGKPFHRFPEVLCGTEICRAKWKDPSGAIHGVMLQRGGPSDEYRVTGEE